ncbi:hypothetical protein NST17_20280 [Caldifermentibacillus hisashii]|uniref:Uncharacterized protein n=1 Tax=Caldifermentibacillus hisashii TaxID=996558 RepID=A0ABU9K4U6_9BACI
MNTTFEKNKLYNHLGDLVDVLKRHKAYVAGGTITSLFSNREINDVDIYFRDEESLIKFLSEIWDGHKWNVSATKKAILMIYDDVQIQLIHFNYFNSPEDIFNTFDFTVCMGCFDFSTDEFVFHPDFLKHNSQRILKFNSDTAYPIVSMLRVQKYEDKGYYISKPEFIRIILTCMKLEINTYEDLKEQLGGMYGINYDKLFEDVKDEKFDLQKAIDKIADITLDESYFVKPEPVEFNNLDDIVATISSEPVKVFKINDTKYRITPWGLIDVANKKMPLTEEIDPKNELKDFKIYKFVKKENDKYYSFYNNKFEYKIGYEVVALTRNFNNGRLYFNQKEDLNSSTYKDEDGVLLEATFNWDDLVDADNGTLMVKKCFVIREVPKEEWENWI